MDNILASKIKELVNKSYKMQSFTKFLNTEEVSQVRILLKRQGCEQCFFYPKDCERKIAFFYPNYKTCDYDIPVKVLKISYKEKVSHRDILGSIMGLSIKREYVGDIIVSDSFCYVYVYETMVDFIINNLDKISRQKVVISEVQIDEVINQESEFELINDTVKSIRFDSVVSSGFKISRNDALTYIKSGKVFLNSKEIIKPDVKIIQGDRISIKGMGKMELFDIGGTSKKERIFIQIKKYI